MQELNNLFDINHVKNPAILLLITSAAAMSFGFQAWIIYLIPHAIDKGLTPYQGTALSSCGCVGQLFGLVLSGLLIDNGGLGQAKVTAYFDRSQNL